MRKRICVLCAFFALAQRGAISRNDAPRRTDNEASPRPRYLSGMQVFTASRLSPLLAQLAHALQRAPLPPRETEIIVVQSQGMRRWVTLQLADTFGCAGSLLLPFPAAFVRNVESRLTGQPPDEADPFSRELMLWRLELLLRDLPEHPDYDPIRGYLQSTDERARFGLAQQIAARFDDYQLYRADVLAAWEKGDDRAGAIDDLHSAWQAKLWRELVRGRTAGPSHLGRRLWRAIKDVRTANMSALPSRVTVFGVSALPPVFIELLGTIATRIPVSVYTALPPHDSDHPLVASLGMQGQEFLSILEEHGGVVQRLPDSVPDARQAFGTSGPSRATVPASLLSTLQHEIARGESGTAELSVGASDRSLRIHDAHGPLRQLEVVRDQLLEAMAHDSSLRPHDLLLLVPDATEWGPLVDAVFGTVGDAAARLPYRIADRPTRRTQPAADAFARLIALEGGRLPRRELFDLLAIPIVRQQAKLSEQEVARLIQVTDRANVRWGYDASTRSAVGLPAYDAASWRKGLDRLLLGLATGAVQADVLELLPEAGDTSGDPVAIARLSAWIDTIDAVLTDWKIARPLAAWSEALSEAIALLCRAETASEQQSLEQLLASVRRLHTVSEGSGHGALVNFTVMREWLQSLLDDDGLGSGFLLGGMTVAALKPMRSLPFRVIAVAGLDNGVFPRRDRRSAFDLLEMQQRMGDRDLRTDDRQLFLDVLLAAETQLILAYSGRAVRDNTPAAPSVVVDELLDHLDARSGGSARSVLVVQHPLQPFPVEHATPAGDAPFVRASLVLAESESIVSLTLDELVECWSNPSQYFCRHTLGFSLSDRQDNIPDDESLFLDKLQQGMLRARLVNASLARADLARDDARLRHQLRESGELPLGALGDHWYTKLNERVDDALALLPQEASRTVTLSLHGAGWRMNGTLDHVRGDTRFVVRTSELRAKHRIRAWVEHVALSAAHEQGDGSLPQETKIVARSGTKLKFVEELSAVDNASALLNELVQTALVARTRALPFFAGAAGAYLEAATRPAKSRKAYIEPLSAARNEYHKEDPYNGFDGDHADPYVSLCFRGIDPMATQLEEFEQLTQLLFRQRLAVGGAS